MSNRTGQIVGNYRLLRLIGAGGFAEVYLGRHIHLDTSVAIKFLITNELQVEGRDRFLREARIIANLVHPNIVRILDYGIDGSIPYLIMDYAPEGTLRRYCEAHEQWKLADIISAITQVAEALQYAHDQGIIHRDVKPANILLGTNNQVLLSDFGIATLALQSILTQTGIVGTPTYMAPEQIQSRPVFASDQYALGIVVYELLCGKTPFQSQTLTEMIYKHLLEAPPSPHSINPNISRSIERIILKALEKEPSKRYPKIIDFAQALQKEVHGQSGWFRGIVKRLGFAEQPIAEPEAQSSVLPAPAFEPTIAANPPDQSLISYYTSDAPNPPTVQPQSPYWITQNDRDLTIPYWDQTVASIAPYPPAPPQQQVPWNRTDYGAPPVPLPPKITIQLPPIIEPEISVAENIRMLLEKGEMHFKKNEKKQLVSALEAFDMVLKLEPANIHALTYKATILGKFKRFSEALEIYNRILQLHPKQTIPILLAKGKTLQELGRPDKALVTYDEALQLEPHHALVWAAKGDVFFIEKSYQAALDAYTHALESNPHHLSVWMNKSKTLLKMKDVEQALQTYEQAQQFFPNEASLWAEAGKIHRRLYHYDDALAAYDFAIKLAPRVHTFWVAKGEMLITLEREEEALFAYEEAYKLKSTDTQIAQKCAMLRKVKQHKDAATQMQAANVQSKPEDKQAPQVFVLNDESVVLDTPPLPTMRAAPQTQPVQNTKTTQQNTAKTVRIEAEATRILGANTTKRIETHDVFLSHAHKDAKWVEELAKRLADEYGLRVWLDVWELPIGTNWQKAIAGALNRVKSCAVCIGKDVTDGWWKPELDKALNIQVQKPDFRVFAVLLPGVDYEQVNTLVDESFIGANTWVDFHKFPYEQALDRLVKGIKGEKPGRWQAAEQKSSDNTISSVVKTMISELNNFDLPPEMRDEMKRQTIEKVWLETWLKKVQDSKYD